MPGRPDPRAHSSHFYMVVPLYSYRHGTYDLIALLGHSRVQRRHDTAADDARLMRATTHTHTHGHGERGL